METCCASLKEMEICGVLINIFDLLCEQQVFAHGKSALNLIGRMFSEKFPFFIEENPFWLGFLSYKFKIRPFKLTINGQL